MYLEFSNYVHNLNIPFQKAPAIYDRLEFCASIGRSRVDGSGADFGAKRTRETIGSAENAGASFAKEIIGSACGTPSEARRTTYSSRIAAVEEAHYCSRRNFCFRVMIR